MSVPPQDPGTFAMTIRRIRDRLFNGRLRLFSALVLPQPSSIVILNLKPSSTEVNYRNYTRRQNRSNDIPRLAVSKNGHNLEQNKSYHGHLSGVYCLAIHPTIDVLLTGVVCRPNLVKTEISRPKAVAGETTKHDNKWAFGPLIIRPILRSRLPEELLQVLGNRYSVICFVCGYGQLTWRNWLTQWLYRLDKILVVEGFAGLNLMGFLSTSRMVDDLSVGNKSEKYFNDPISEELEEEAMEEEEGEYRPNLNSNT
ncbi:hypothetical protein L1887_29264 [Cichorium endivia]|nr:hypothetical protein L1887_29264 [Cichorium endivia]